MDAASVRPADEEMEELVTHYAAMLFRLCFTMLGSSADAEDAVADTFLRYLTKAPAFREEEHRRAWLLKVAANRCRDLCRARKRRDWVPLESIETLCGEPEDRGILEALTALPEKYRETLHLFYIEGYKTAEIAAILFVTAGTVRKRLQYGRELLRRGYGKDGIV